ncbi:MAG: beta-galactosidase [Verrucomicrobia bacterium]|nr:beta-galactosidase [Verrucomicrobiota bacterium]
MRTTDTDPSNDESRREFLKKTAAATALLAGADMAGFAASTAQREEKTTAQLPWYRRALRWGQTNITEIDPALYDIAWWRQHWKRTQVQGVIINAGGIFAYYPSKFPLHYRPKWLGDRDLYGELARAAHEEGLAVLARMDSNRVSEEFYRAHPDWFALDAGGRPYRAGDRYVTCVNSPYYEEYIPGILREIIERSHPEGFTDNSWSGLGRSSICHCENCQRKFRGKTGQPIPKEKNWNDPAYRQWIQWNYARRLEIWDLNNRTTKAAGGPDCLWVGMNSGSVGGQSASFRDLKEICARTEIILLDHQARSDASGFQQNGETGKLVHGLLGWDKVMPESMAMYQAGRPTFRLSSKPEPEARMWMLDGFAGGIQPWWHHVGAYHEDRRMYRTAEPILRWHRENERFLVNRQPVATVGVVWSQQNTDFFGRDNADDLVELPWRGVTNALIRARILYLPVHTDHIERDASKLSLLILPNYGAMSEAHIAIIRRFIDRGGGLIATGRTSLYNEWGDPRTDFALADLFQAHVVKPPPPAEELSRRRTGSDSQHTYLRLTPELKARVYGPKAGTEPAVTQERHPALRGFDDTDILPFGGALEPLRVEPMATVLLTFIPSFPVYPPETAWMREPKTDIPGLIVNTSTKGRVAFMPADLDRRFATDNLPDHGNLLANLIRWAANDRIPLSVEGPGLIDSHLYQQENRLILHLVNLTSAGTWRQPVHELIAVGPLRVKVQLPPEVRAKKVELMVSRKKTSLSVRNGWALFEIASVLDHEVVVVG